MKKLLSIIILLSLFPNKNYSMGCNFGFTHTVIVGPSYSYTIGQGPWGKRKYVMNWGDGSPADIAYSTPSNSVFITHTYSVNGNYFLNINSSDTLGGGCLSYGNFNFSVNYYTTGVFTTNNYSRLLVQTVFNDEVIINNSTPQIYKIEILNSSGQVLVKQSILPSELKSFETKFFQEGIYFIYLFSELGRIRVLKAIKNYQ